MLSAVAEIYRSSKKRKDINWFTQHIARPPAALLVYLMKGTPITPNQVTFLATAVCAGACAIFALTPGSWIWLGVAAAVFELSFILDCVDGMLARIRKHASPLGHLLDFLMDELKASMVYGAVTIRLYRETGDVRMLLVGIGGMYVISSGITLTTFMRRPEYGEAKAASAEGQQAVVGGRRGPVGIVLNAFEWASRLLVHYPQYIWLAAAVNHMEVYWWAYGGVCLLYLGMSFLKIMRKTGRFGAPKDTFT